MLSLFLSGRLWWPTDVQGASSYGRRIYGNWLCPSRVTGHLHTRQQICAVDAKCAEQQAIECRLNCLAECDSTVIFTIIRKLNVKNKLKVVLLAEHKFKPRAHIKRPANLPKCCRSNHYAADMAAPTANSCT